MGGNDQGSEKGQCFEKISSGPIHAANYTLKWRHFFFSVTSRPSVAILVTDKMECSYQVQETKDGRIGKVTEFRRHLGIGGCFSFSLLQVVTNTVHFDPPRDFLASTS